MKQYGVVGIGFFVASAVISALVYVLVPKYELVIDDQFAGTTVFVKRLVLPRSAFIAMRPFSFAPVNNNELIISDYMPAGVYTDFYIDLMDMNVALKPGMEIFVSLLQDNGDAYFDADLDTPVRTWYGKEFYQKITLR
jgi:hypothetical protein